MGLVQSSLPVAGLRLPTEEHSRKFELPTPHVALALNDDNPTLSVGESV